MKAICDQFMHLGSINECGIADVSVEMSVILAPMT